MSNAAYEYNSPTIMKLSLSFRTYYCSVLVYCCYVVLSSTPTYTKTITRRIFRSAKLLVVKQPCTRGTRIKRHFKKERELGATRSFRDFWKDSSENYTHTKEIKLCFFPTSRQCSRDVFTMLFPSIFVNCSDSRSTAFIEKCRLLQVRYSTKMTTRRVLKFWRGIL